MNEHLCLHVQEKMYWVKLNQFTNLTLHNQQRNLQFNLNALPGPYKLTPVVKGCIFAQNRIFLPPFKNDISPQSTRKNCSFFSVIPPLPPYICVFFLVNNPIFFPSHQIFHKMKDIHPSSRVDPGPKHFGSRKQKSWEIYFDNQYNGIKKQLRMWL